MAKNSTTAELLTPLRIRDLVHGFVSLTELENAVIDRPLFQRLRHIRQNDVASFVYPSLNISRFEHSLGTCFVAGKMASSIKHSAQWQKYLKAVDLEPSEFEQCCRLYALLHDIGHLPLSHLFELAFDDHVAATAPEKPLQKACAEWFGGAGFTKLHEACGSVLVKIILDEVDIPRKIKNVVLALTQQKTMEATNPLRPIKLIVDSEVDADRIDSTARDGKLAGGEYGVFDIDRICSSVRIQERDGRWTLAYSKKAIGSIEALLLDRYRTHTWIHFHHRVVGMKAAARLLIRRLMELNEINRNHFREGSYKSTVFRDDVWLWSLLRSENNKHWNSPALGAARNALLYRTKSGIQPLWKGRVDYQKAMSTLQQLAQVREISGPAKQKLNRAYESELSTHLKADALVLWLKFKPVENEAVHLTDEVGNSDEGELAGRSALIESLPSIWAKEPQFYVVLMGNNLGGNLAQKWLEFTAAWLSK